MRVSPTHLLCDERAVLHAESRILQCVGFWANPVPSLDDQLRMLQHSCVLVWSSCRLRLNTLSRYWRVLRKCHSQHRLRCVDSRSNHWSTLKHPFSVRHWWSTQTSFLYHFRKNLRITNTFFSVHRPLVVKLLTSSTLFPRFRCGRDSRWVFFCCHTLFVAWQPWPLERI